MIQMQAPGAFLAPVDGARRLVRLVQFLLLAAVLLVGVMILGGVLAGAAGLSPLLAELPIDGVPEGPDRLIGESVFIAVLAVVLSLMAGAILAAAAIVWRRAPRSFLWPGRRVSWRLLAWGFVFMALTAALSGAVATALGTRLDSPLFDGAYGADTRWLYAATAGAGLLAAAAAEEVVLRGVVLQITAAFTRNAWVLCVLNGMVFAAIHFDPDPVAFVSRALSGAAWAWAALRLGGLEFAIGAHWANNLMISLFAEPFSGAAAIGQGYPLHALLMDLPVAAATVVAVELLALRRASA